ncbi:DUF2268 domain-containing putative Zn-dependent protease [Paracoccus sanguinis]|uniref:DUF2268 domain-containing putative Zn-dependent protease n=1 Tax=Paracoccus sanguinis TaxID=1545044 RepID=UPI0014528132|nr:DUF2268 domain-containing putative Zn-dependent protease [Paracoccus sanguinis]QJD17170.1 DUF2268 domain-containing protein [Paracoccus sanguinis]
MTYYQLHPLNARHGLTAVLPGLRATVAEAVRLTQAHAALPDFDVTVRVDPDRCIPGWGVGGLAPAPGVIEIALIPDLCTPERLIRTLVHEFHHLIRWDGPGYGRTLGEALVSEGLAGQFVREVLGGPPDPWDQTPVAEGLAKRAIAEWSRPGYDHGAWFFGQGELRRWVGYGLGARIVAEALAAAPDATAVTLATAPAEQFRPVLRRLASRAAGVEAAAEDEAPDGDGDGDGAASPSEQTNISSPGDEAGETERPAPR